MKKRALFFPNYLKNISKGSISDFQLLRLAIESEFDAISLYEQIATLAECPQTIKVVESIIREEKAHVGELQSLLFSKDREQLDEFISGIKEVNEIVEPVSGLNVIITSRLRRLAKKIAANPFDSGDPFFAPHERGTHEETRLNDFRSYVRSVKEELDSLGIDLSTPEVSRYISDLVDIWQDPFSGSVVISPKDMAARIERLIKKKGQIYKDDDRDNEEETFDHLSQPELIRETGLGEVVFVPFDTADPEVTRPLEKKTLFKGSRAECVEFVRKNMFAPPYYGKGRLAIIPYGLSRGEILPTPIVRFLELVVTGTFIGPTYGDFTRNYVESIRRQFPNSSVKLSRRFERIVEKGGPIVIGEVNSSLPPRPGEDIGPEDFRIGVGKVLYNAYPRFSLDRVDFVVRKRIPKAEVDSAVAEMENIRELSDGLIVELFEVEDNSPIKVTRKKIGRKKI